MFVFYDIITLIVVMITFCRVELWAKLVFSEITSTIGKRIYGISPKQTFIRASVLDLGKTVLINWATYAQRIRFDQEFKKFRKL